MSIVGCLCTTDPDLKKNFRRRCNKYDFKTVLNSQVSTCISEGWQAVHEGTYRTKVQKLKPPNVYFEDMVWSLFYQLGFTHMNVDSFCTLNYDAYSKRIDVLARDEIDQKIFVIECKHTESDNTINVRDDLNNYVGNKGYIDRAIKEEWGNDCGKISVIVVISSREKRRPDEEYVEMNRNRNVLLWSFTELEYIKNLIEQGGKAAKYQLYSILFGRQKQPTLKYTRPAIEGKIGSNNFYYFVIPAKQLIKYAYVHHRNLRGIVEMSQVYQRMLRNSKLNSIAGFIDNKGGYFPNNIIVNFSKRITWHKLRKFEDVSMGTLSFPEYYGSAWVIDGQHRLYGAARAGRDLLLNVLAFERMRELEQANLFVFINENQTKVEPHLLWDLYSDIYRDTEDKRQKKRYQIAEAAKIMTKSGVFRGKIDIPSIPASSQHKLKLTTVCDTIEKFAPWHELANQVEEAEIPSQIAGVFDSFFSALKELWPENWAEGNKGVLLTNNSFGVFTMVMYDIVRYMIYKDKGYLLKPNRKSDLMEYLKTNFLSHLIDKLKCDTDLQSGIRKGGGRGPQNDNAIYLDLFIKEAEVDFSPPRTRQLPPLPEPEQPPPVSAIEQKARIAEQKLRHFILESIIRYYGDGRWWDEGVCRRVKDRADALWRQEIARKPALTAVINQEERKFELLGFGDIIEVIIHASNWTNIFRSIFVDQEQVRRRINDIQAIRNPSTHMRTIDEQDVIDGISGLLWLSTCLADPQLHPYN